MKTKIPRRLPKPSKLDSVEREYYRRLSQYQRAFEKMMRDGLRDLIPELKDVAGDELPNPRQDSDYIIVSQQRMDANIEKGIRALFESVQSRLMAQFPDTLLAKWARAMVGHVNKGVKRNVQKVASAVDLDLEPIMKDSELHPYFQNVVDENVGLIRSISQYRLTSLKNALVYGVTQDLNVKDISAMIESNFRVTKNKARLIARDQVGKLNGAIQRYRQESIGGKRYVWRGTNDVRERDDHRKLNGKTFSWNNPPVVDRRTGRRGHPGEDYQCRCYPEMVLEDVVE